jgi:hypothetical protein
MTLDEINEQLLSMKESLGVDQKKKNKIKKN